MTLRPGYSRYRAKTSPSSRRDALPAWLLEIARWACATSRNVRPLKSSWRDPLRSLRSLRESLPPVSGKEDNRSDGIEASPAYAGADHQEVA